MPAVEGPWAMVVWRVQANTVLKQRFVIAEAIKTSSIPVEKLLSLVDDGDLHPSWEHMLLPLGKPSNPSSVGQLLAVAEILGYSTQIPRASR